MSILLLLQASGHEPPEGHFVTVPQKCPPGPLSHVYFRQDSYVQSETILSMSVCLFNFCLPAGVCAPPSRGLSSPCSEQAPNKCLMNRQMNELGIMFWFGLLQKDTGQGFGCKWFIWKLISGGGGGGTTTTESCGDWKEVGEWDREGTETGKTVDFCVRYYYGQLELFLGALGAEQTCLTPARRNMSLSFHQFTWVTDWGLLILKHSQLASTHRHSGLQWPGKALKKLEGLAVANLAGCYPKP